MGKSIYDIARLAGVSTATVSRVLNGSGYASGATRERILAVAAANDYRPKPYKKQNRTPCFGTVGVVIPDICNNYYMEVIHGIEETLNPRGVEVVICNTDEDPRKEIRSLALLQQLKVAGVIAVPVSDAERYNAEHLLAMNSAGTHVVLLDRDLPGGELDGVFMDNYGSGYQSTRTFLQNGHTDIAIVCGPATSTSGAARLEGYRAALREAGVPVRRELILDGDFKFELAYDLTRRMIARRTRATAIFACNSRMALGCTMALAESGLSIPQDMAFISCGRMDAGLSRISTVVYPTHAIGSECARILLEKLDNPRRDRNGPRRRTTFDMELMLKGSEVFPANHTRTEAASQ